MIQSSAAVLSGAVYTYNAACFGTGVPLSDEHAVLLYVQGGSNMTGTYCDLFTHK